MTEKKEPLAVRAARGEYDLVVPLDYLLLEKLQPPGTMLAGLYEIGTAVKELKKGDFSAVPTGTISGRLRILSVQGLTKKVKLVGASAAGSQAWQRTEAGEALLKKWKAENGNG